MQEWLDWQQQAHPTAIDLGLSRIRQVLQRLGLRPDQAPVLSIAGTNGKGSCARAAEALALAAGRRVGCYTSPHLWRYNERIRINGQAVDDAALVAAFERIELARGEVSLSYFEFGTLAALCLFEQAELELWILEVGLGGRLDAVNVWDADVAVVTSVGLDHQEWLGSELDQIGREKAAIARPGKPLLLGRAVPASARQVGHELGAQLIGLGQEWSFELKQGRIIPDRAAAWCDGIQVPANLVVDNLLLAGLALEALGLLPDPQTSQQVLGQLRVPGRCERRLVGQREEIIDVAHNLDAVAHLAAYLRSLPACDSTTIIFAALADKPIEQMSATLDPWATAWIIVPLSGPRALPVDALASRMCSSKPITRADSVAAALVAARNTAQRIVVCGSFLSVAAVGESEWTR